MTMSAYSLCISGRCFKFCFSFSQILFILPIFTFPKMQCRSSKFCCDVSNYGLGRGTSLSCVWFNFQCWLFSSSAAIWTSYHHFGLTMGFLLVPWHSASWILCRDSFSDPCGLHLSEISKRQCQWFVRNVLSDFRSLALASSSKSAWWANWLPAPRGASHAHSDALYPARVLCVKCDKKHLQENKRGTYTWLCFHQGDWNLHNFSFFFPWCSWTNPWSIIHDASYGS